jgi:hypothetical protein
MSRHKLKLVRQRRKQELQMLPSSLAGAIVIVFTDPC